MRSDVNYSHSKNIGEPIGDFCGVPICSYNNFDLELDVVLDAQRIVLRNKAMGCSDAPSTAEILPGEVLCADNILRRATTAEASGRVLNTQAVKPAMIFNGTGRAWGYDEAYNVDLSLWVHRTEARDSYIWNPNMHRMVKEETNSQHRGEQSTPEELCIWLNDLPNQNNGRDAKRSFKSRVEVDGADKLFITDNVNGKPMYSFRYFDGNPGTYLGGEEVRPLDPLQRVVGRNSPSHVVQYFDDANDECARASSENAVESIYADEYMFGVGELGARRYAPSTSIDNYRITTHWGTDEEA